MTSQSGRLVCSHIKSFENFLSKKINTIKLSSMNTSKYRHIKIFTLSVIMLLLSILQAVSSRDNRENKLPLFSKMYWMVRNRKNQNQFDCVVHSVHLENLTDSAVSFPSH